MTFRIALAAAVFPLSALAVGTEDDAAPSETTTTENCAECLVFDTATQTCLPPDQSTNDDSAMLDDIRRLAYEGRYAAARRVLDAMPDQADSMVLTYRGFVTRKSGDLDGGLAYYAAALSVDPGNVLTLSYRGMAYVENAELTLARADLEAIWAAGGQGTRAEAALAEAIRTGVGVSY